MQQFNQMLRKVNTSPYYDSIRQFVAPLRDHFGIKHFWYYKITNSGHYSYLGTHTKWDEFCFDQALLSYFPCLRHPDTLYKGISLMKAGAQGPYKELLDTAWEKFQLNFNINLTNSTSDGIEAFGFATCVNDCRADERLLNELPLLKCFIRAFREKYKEVFTLLKDSEIDLSEVFGSNFYVGQSNLALPIERDLFLKKLGLFSAHKLTSRELDILKFLSYGYPSSFIAKKLYLSVRTVENYVCSIKSKLDCNSKVELIQKASDINSLSPSIYEIF